MQVDNEPTNDILASLIEDLATEQVDANNQSDRQTAMTLQRIQNAITRNIKRRADLEAAACEDQADANASLAPQSDSNA